MPAPILQYEHSPQSSAISHRELGQESSGFIGSSVLHEGIVADITPGGSLTLPDYLGSHETIVPSIEVRTFRGKEVALVPAFQADNRLESMFQKVVKGRQDRIEKMALEMLVRIVDTSGADGLHHMHSQDTKLPRTVFYNVRPGSGLQLYMTSLGKTREGKPLYGLIGATNGAKDERNFLRIVGNIGSRVKGRS